MAKVDRSTAILGGQGVGAGSCAKASARVKMDWARGDDWHGLVTRGRIQLRDRKATVITPV